MKKIIKHYPMTDRLIVRRGYIYIYMYINRNMTFSYVFLGGGGGGGGGGGEGYVLYTPCVLCTSIYSKYKYRSNSDLLCQPGFVDYKFVFDKVQSIFHNTAKILNLKFQGFPCQRINNISRKIKMSPRRQPTFSSQVTLIFFYLLL